MRNRNISPVFLIIMLVLLAESAIRGMHGSPMDWVIDKLYIIPAIIIGISFHEFGHAIVAYKLGDNTPKFQGRVTMNPAAHIDPVGLLALLLCGFGWGAPVQINPYNFKNRRRDELLVAFAGVIMNLLVAIVFTIIAKILIVCMGSTWLVQDRLGSVLWLVIIYIIQINIVLMIFNLIPCPPLDGFNIIAQIGNFGQSEIYWTLYRYGNLVLIFLIVFNVTHLIITPCVSAIMNLIWGIIL